MRACVRACVRARVHERVHARVLVSRYQGIKVCSITKGIKVSSIRVPLLSIVIEYIVP